MVCPEQMDSRVSQTLAIVKSSYSDRCLSIAEIAHGLCVSVSRLQHLVRRDTGASFGEHLHKTRTGAAALLLANTSLRVNEVAARVGYSGTLALERHFKALFGRTPTEFKHSGSVVHGQLEGRAFADQHPVAPLTFVAT